MSVGRPSKYNDETVKISREYIDNFEDHDDVIPSVAGLACVLGVSRENIYDWGKQESKKDFSDMLVDLQSKQERVLFNKGLSGEFNSNIVKLALTKHGYSDKSSQDITSGGEKIDNN